MIPPNDANGIANSEALFAGTGKSENLGSLRFLFFLSRSENEGEEKPTNKRLRWVSAMDKTQSSSLHSSTTSNSRYVSNELGREKTCLRGFQPGPKQTILYSHRRYSHRRYLESWNFGFRKYRNCTIYVVKTKANAKNRFSHDTA